MKITKSTTNITVNGKSYGSVEEMDVQTRQSYDQAMGQLSDISNSVSEKKTESLETSFGSAGIENKNGNGMSMFVLGILVGMVIMYFLK
ncbi:MAG: hypothetical protein WAV41_02590 [Microgenomates group bacterium]